MDLLIEDILSLMSSSM